MMERTPWTGKERMQNIWGGADDYFFYIGKSSLFYPLERNGATLEEMCRLNNASSAMVGGELFG